MDGTCSECGAPVHEMDPVAVQLDAVVCSDKCSEARARRTLVGGERQPRADVLTLLGRIMEGDDHDCSTKSDRSIFADARSIAVTMVDALQTETDPLTAAVALEIARRAIVTVHSIHDDFDKLVAQLPFDPLRCTCGHGSAPLFDHHDDCELVHAAKSRDRLLEEARRSGRSFWPPIAAVDCVECGAEGGESPHELSCKVGRTQRHAILEAKSN